MPLIAGSQLTDDQRAEVLRVYVHRNTKEHANRYALSTGKCLCCREPWSLCLGTCQVFYDTDQAWIEAHAFYVTRRGRLDLRHDHCEPHYLAEVP